MRLVCAFLALIPNLLRAQPIPNYYVQEGRRITITVDTLRIAVRLRHNLPVTPDSLFVPNRFLERDPARREFHAEQKIWIIPLSADGVSRGVEFVQRTLLTDHAFSFVGIPVTSQGRNTMVLMNEVVAAFKPGVSSASQAAILDSLQLTGVSEQRRRPERLRLRSRSGSAIDALRAANQLAERGDVRFAQPNFIVRSRLQSVFGCA